MTLKIVKIYCYKMLNIKMSLFDVDFNTEIIIKAMISKNITLSAIPITRDANIRGQGDSHPSCHQKMFNSYILLFVLPSFLIMLTSNL